MARFQNLNVNKLNIVSTGPGEIGSGLFYLKGTTKNISANGTTAAITLNALTIPANTLVLDVFTTVVTSANATCTATIGDGDSATGWDASVNMVVAAGTRAASAKGTDAFALAGKVYSSQDTIDAFYTCSTTTCTGAFRIDALCAKL